MLSRWVAVVAVGAMWQVPLGAARADMTIAQAAPAPAAQPAPAPYPAQPAPPPYPMQPAPPPYYPMPMPMQLAPPVMTGPRVILRIDRRTARLQQETALGWRNLCEPPCGAIVDPAGVYRIGGSGAVVSEPFQLPRASGDVYVDGHVGAKASRFAGLGLMLGGLGAALYCFMIWSGSVDGTWSAEGARNIGILGLVSGAGLAAIGMVLYSGAYTSVQAR